MYVSMGIQETAPNSRVHTVWLLKLDNVTFEMTAATWENRSSSNDWYGKKIMVGTIIWHILKRTL